MFYFSGSYLFRTGMELKVTVVSSKGAIIDRERVRNSVLIKMMYHSVVDASSRLSLKK